MRFGKFSLGATVPLVLASMASAAVDQTVGVAPSDGMTMLVKRFSVAKGTVIVGAQFQNNDPRTIFPEVVLVRGVASAMSEGTVAARVSNVSETATGIVSVTWSRPIQAAQSEDYYLGVRMPAGARKQGPGNGPAIGASRVEAPGGSFVAGGTEGGLTATSVDLAMGLVTGGIGKAAVNPSEQAPLRTFLSGGANPATAVVKIQFGVEMGMHVRLGVFNIAGRRIRELTDGAMAAGTYAREWDSRDDQGHEVAAGIYFARLEAGSKVITQKMVLAR